MAYLSPYNNPGYDYDVWEVLPGVVCRGPSVDTDKPFILCLGAAQTFCPLVDRAWPAQLAAQLEFPVLNMGLGGAGPEYYNELPMPWLHNVRAVIVQAMSARSVSCEYWQQPTGHRCYTDGQQVVWEELFGKLIRIGMAVRATRAAHVYYRLAYRALAKKLAGIPSLFWCWSKYKLKGDYKEFPHLVTEALVSRVARHFDQYVHIVSRIGLPSKIRKGCSHIHGNAKNSYYPSQEIVDLIARRLEEPTRQLLTSPVSPRSSKPQKG